MRAVAGGFRCRSAARAQGVTPPMWDPAFEHPDALARPVAARSGDRQARRNRADDEQVIGLGSL